MRKRNFTDVPGKMLGTNSSLVPCHRPLNHIDDRAAAFLSSSGQSETLLDPLSLSDRVGINSDMPFEFENDYFVGSVTILHRQPEDAKTGYRYRDFFSKKKRRWELRWQGRFKQPVESSIVFGAEFLSSHSPKHNFASRAFLSLLFKFSASLARNRGADLHTNMVSDQPATTKYFFFPVHSSDLILSTPEGVAPPSLVHPSDLTASEVHTACNAAFKSDAAPIDISKTYTFVFYSMYADFVSWDVQNVPFGLSGMSLNRLVGTQPISVVMRSGLEAESPVDYFRLVIGNRCTSPDWSSFLTTGERFNALSMSEFFSIVSSFDGVEDLPGPRRISRKKSSRIMAGFRSATKLLASCLRAPVSFVSGSSRRSTPKRRKRQPPAIPDSKHLGDFVTPISGPISEEAEQFVLALVGDTGSDPVREETLT